MTDLFTGMPPQMTSFLEKFLVLSEQIDDRVQLSYQRLELEALEVAALKSANLPEAYIVFLERFGSVQFRDPGDPDNYPPNFELLSAPLLATSEVFQDEQIYSYGARGEVFVFGFESDGVAYGFDSGNHNALVVIDLDRSVEILEIKFEEFMLGLLVCYPQIPERFENGMWYDFDESFALE